MTTTPFPLAPTRLSRRRFRQRFREWWWRQSFEVRFRLALLAMVTFFAALLGLSWL